MSEIPRLTVPYFETGADWEMEVFQWHSDRMPTGLKPDFKMTLTNVLKNQWDWYRWDTIEPTTVAGQRIVTATRRHLPQDLAKQTEIICAIDSDLDVEFGIDGGITFTPLRTELFIGFDLTTNPWKGDNGKVLVTPHCVYADPDAVGKRLTDRMIQAHARLTSSNAKKKKR